MAAKIKPSLVGITGLHSSGVGFFVDVDGGRPNFDYILTSYSLVNDECRVTVHLPPRGFETQGSRVLGQLFAKDEALNLALVEVATSASPAVEWGDWKGLKIGDRVFAFGFSDTNKPTNNFIEGGVKDKPTRTLSGIERSPEASFVLTDIQETPDYKGGPLVNLEGQVLGINFTDVDSPDEGTDRALSRFLLAQPLVEVMPRLSRGTPILKTTPTSPVAGQPVSFTLETQPYQAVRVTLLDPQGQEAAWIYPEGTTKYREGEPVTTRTLGADGCGKVEWVRRGFLDNEGDWTARITLGPNTAEPKTTTFTYTISGLELKDQETVHMWTELRRHQGSASEAFYSELVPAALAVDLESQLVSTVDLLEKRLGVKTSEIPDLYLMGNRTLFEQVEQYMRMDAGFEIAFYAAPCPNCYQARSGIYIQADAHETETQLHLTLAHEYAHALVDEIANDRGEVLPTWVNEGFATWSEYETGKASERPKAAYRSLFYRADTARSAAMSGDLMALSSLESNLSWNDRTGDQVTLQYAEAYMAVRYLIETYGPSSAVGLITDLGLRGNLTLAIKQVTGVSYPEFESQFVAWLKQEEPTTSYSQRGRDYYAAGEYQEAVNQFSILIAIDPSRAIAYNQRGIAYYSLKKYREAVEDFGQAIRLEPSDATDYTNRGSSHYQLGQYPQAIRDFDQAIRLDASDGRGYNWRGAAYGKLDQEEQARSDRDKACSLDSRYC